MKYVQLVETTLTRLKEIAFQKMFNVVDSGRKDRSRKVKVKVTDKQIRDDGNDFIKFATESLPADKNEVHFGYLIRDPQDKDIKRVFCSCEDFYHRAYKNLIDKELAPTITDLPDEYEKLVRDKYGLEEPEDNIEKIPSVCKHLAAVLSKFRV